MVQSYVPGVLDDLGVPVGDARPSGSTQRFVTAEELRDGVWVDLVQLEAAAEAVLIAWIEWDEADLDFDAHPTLPSSLSPHSHAASDSERSLAWRSSLTRRA